MKRDPRPMNSNREMETAMLEESLNGKDKKKKESVKSEVMQTVSYRS